MQVQYSTAQSVGCPLALISFHGFGSNVGGSATALLHGSLFGGARGRVCCSEGHRFVDIIFRNTVSTVSYLGR